MVGGNIRRKAIYARVVRKGELKRARQRDDNHLFSSRNTYMISLIGNKTMETMKEKINR